MALFRPKDGDRPSARALAKRAKEAEDPRERAALYTQAGDAAVAKNKGRRAIELFELALQALQQARVDARTLAAAQARIAQTAERIGAVDDAIAGYMQAFGLDPSLVAAVRAARRLAEGRGDWPRTSELFEHEILVVADRRERAELMREHAAILRDRLDDIEGAITLLKRAVKSDPKNTGVRRDLAASLVKRADRREDLDWAARDRDEAAEVLCALADIVSDEERVACLDTALDVAPEHLGALERLERAAPDDMDRLVYRWAKHIEAFPEGPISDELRLRLARAHVDAGRNDAALPLFEHLARQNDIDSALVVVDLHATAGRFDDARAWANAVQDRAPAAERLPILRHIFAALRKGRAEDVHDIASAILELDPADADALELSVAISAKAGDWEAAEQLLTRVALRPEVGRGRRLELLVRIARLQENERQDLVRALGTWRRIEQESEGAPTALEARRERIRLAEATSGWDELADLIEEDARKSKDPARRSELLRTLVVVHRDRRTAPEPATVALLALITLEGGGPAAATLRRELAELLRQAGADSEVLVAAEELAARSKDAERAALYRVLGREFDHWKQHEKAFDAWTQAREVAPDDDETLERLVAAAIETGRHAQAVEILGARAERADDEAAIAFHRRIAAIATEHLSDSDRAADALAVALDLAPEDRELAEELCAALGRAKRFGEQTVVLRLLATSAPDDEERREIRIRLARVLAGELRDPSEALFVWEHIAADTEDAALLEKLAADARAEGDLARLDVMLARRIVVEPSADRRREVALERAELLAEKLDRPRDAIRVLITSSAGDAREDLPTLSYLESLAEKAEDDHSLASAIELQVPLVPATTRKLLLRRLADLYEGPLGDSPLAVRTLTRWEELEVADTEPRSRLVPHFARSRRWEALLSRLDTLFQLTPEGTEGWVRAVVQALDEADHGPDPDLAAFYMELARRAGSPAQRLVLVTRAAEMFDASGEPESAFAAASQALALAGPDDGLLSLAERLVGPAGAAAKLDAIYDRFTEPGVSFELRKTLVLRHSVLLGATGRYGDALDRLLRVSSVAPVDLELLDALEMVASRSGRLPEVLSAYEDRTAMVGTGDRGVLLMLRAALLCFAFDRAHDVLRFFARAIDLCDASPELLAHVEKTADDLGRSAVEHIMTVYEAAAGKTADDELAADYLVRSARAMLKISPEAVDAALGLLKRALALSPTAEWVLDELETVAIAGARVEQLDEHYEEVIAQTMSDAVAAALLRRRGKILHAHIGRPSDAADVYLRLWALRPDDPDVFRAIRVCLIETGRIQELISATERELDHRENETQRLQLMCDVAALWEEAKNPWEALDAWKRVLEVAPDDARAKEAIDRIGRSKGRDAAES